MISSLRKYKYIIQIFIFSKGKVHGKCASKHTKLHNSGEHAPEPPLADAWICHTYAAWRECKYPHAYKNILNPPPPLPEMKS